MNIDTDASSSPQIGEMIGSAGTNQQLHDQYNSGSQEARGLLTRPDGYNSGLAYGDNATTAAIKSRYMQGYNRQEKELSTENMLNANKDNIKKLQIATDMAGQEVELNKQKELLKWKIKQANKAHRGAVLGNVLGIVGAVAGGAVAAAGSFGIGTVGGAAAGYAGGQALGNSIGGG